MKKPRLPVGQTETKKWPVLNLGRHPRITRETWKLTIDGAVEKPVVLDWTAFIALEQVDDLQDFHCVTSWSRFDLRFRGVLASTALALATPLQHASHIMAYGYDGYSTNISLEEVLKPGVLLAHAVDGVALSLEHGGPVRLVTPQLYAWKGAKWISRLEVMTENRRGYWEQRGYSDTALPWEDDRYGS